MAEMTERQAKAWPEAVAELNEHAGGSIPEHPLNWRITWDEESRPGRGHLLDATYADGEYFCQIRMDVYGYPSVSIAETTWIHANGDEECPCGHADVPEDES